MKLIVKYYKMTKNKLNKRKKHKKRTKNRMNKKKNRFLKKN